jgi:hypothetical protein
MIGVGMREDCETNSNISLKGLAGRQMKSDNEHSTGRTNVVKVIKKFMTCYERTRAAVNLVAPGPPGIVEVLKPSCRITASKSAFCNGFERDAKKTLLASFVSTPL